MPQPRPLHRRPRGVKGNFLGSVRTEDYYITHDLAHVWIVRHAQGHKMAREQGISVTILQLLAWSETDMVNRIKAVRMMLDD